MTINIVNGTAHEINIYKREDTFTVQDGRKSILMENAMPIQVIAAGTPLNCQTGNKPLYGFANSEWLVGGVEFTSYDEIPDADLVIVSNMFRSAVIERGGDVSKLATVFGAVYKDVKDIRPCGVLALAVG